MTSLQIGLIVAGVVLVAGVLLYNWAQERRVRRRMGAALAPRGRGADALLDTKRAAAGRGTSRVEPTLGEEASARPPALPENPPGPVPEGDDATPFEPPGDIIRCATDDLQSLSAGALRGGGDGLSSPAATERGNGQPDPDIESIVTIQPVHPSSAGALAAGLHARLGKPLRWFGRQGPDTAWQRLASDTRGEFTEIAACLLLADRSGAASAPLLDAFIRLAGEVAASLPGAFVAPNAAAEAERAEALDRICADLDVQIGLTLLKTGPATIPGTKLRGVAEAAGFRLAAGGRFEWVQEDTGAMIYALQNYRSEPFTVDSLRLMATPGAVLLLDVPRVADPVRAFDQMKLAGKRMAQTLDAALVDDNRRVLDDAALAAIRQQVQSAAAAMKEVRIDPGSPRALALFGG